MRAWHATLTGRRHTDMQTDSQTLPVLSPYQQIGGEAAVRALVKRFYELMDSLPEARDVRRMHPEDLSGSEEKLFPESVFICHRSNTTC
jgi:hemoglobin